MKVNRQIICTTCAGTGASDKKKYECTFCNGTGAREIYRQMGIGVMRQMIHCDQCFGKGSGIPKNKICGACTGQKIIKSSRVITIDIEKGTKHGKQIRFRGEADEIPGHQTGDLIFTISEEKHVFFERDGDNLLIKKDIPLVNALTGFSFQLVHLDGKKLLVETPPGMIIEPDSVLEIPDQGMPIQTYSVENGSMYVKFNVIFPKKLETTQISQLLNTLPDVIKPPKMTGEFSVATLQPVDHNRQYRRQQTRSAYDSSDEDERGHGGHGQGVQCAQQ